MMAALGILFTLLGGVLLGIYIWSPYSLPFWWLLVAILLVLLGLDAVLSSRRR